MRLSVRTRSSGTHRALPRQRRTTIGVEKTQIAPTILRLLRLDTSDLQAVRLEGTQVLPGIGG
jgi:hypothetical protein